MKSPMHTFPHLPHLSHRKSMTDRGVTRPSGMENENESQKPHEPETQENRNDGQSSTMDRDHRMQMMQQHHQQIHWIYWIIILLGVWLLINPLTFSYKTMPTHPAGDRPVWLSLESRIQVLQWNDICCGFLLVILGYRSLLPNRPLSIWMICLIGVWLNAAPLLFWSPSAIIYYNDTFVGTGLIAFTILIPGMPNMILHMKMGPEIPPGWSYNPSSWAQRSIMIGLGFAGWMVSRYLAAYQLGYISHPWDPFFGEGSRKVLTSNMSQFWPISDAGLGAFSYTFEFLMGWMGSPSRWRTMPWMVTFFGILVIPLGLTHIFLVISQPVVVGEWCSLCLLAALIMLPMIPLEVDEVVAMIQFLIQAKRDGKPFWQTFWMGDTIYGGGKDERTPSIQSFYCQPKKVFFSSLWGMSFPWTLVLASIAGIELVFSPTWFGQTDQAANLNHIAGSLIVTVSVISMGEVVRFFRLANVFLALSILIGAWFLPGSTTTGLVNDIVVSIGVIALSFPRGRIRESFGTWNRYIV